LAQEALQEENEGLLIHRLVDLGDCSRGMEEDPTSQQNWVMRRSTIPQQKTKIGAGGWEERIPASVSSKGSCS